MRCWHRGLVIILICGLLSGVCWAAYHHEGEQDAGVFLFAYPDKAGTKLDSCNLCHSGGQYVDSKGKTSTRQLPVVPLHLWV